MIFSLQISSSKLDLQEEKKDRSKEYLNKKKDGSTEYLNFPSTLPKKDDALSPETEAKSFDDLQPQVLQ